MNRTHTRHIILKCVTRMEPTLVHSNASAGRAFLVELGETLVGGACIRPCSCTVLIEVVVEGRVGSHVHVAVLQTHSPTTKRVEDDRGHLTSGVRLVLQVMQEVSMLDM